MGKRPRNRLELRAEVEAAEARGMMPAETRPRSPRSPSTESRPKSSSSTRMKIVWAVCDIGGRTIVTFDFPQKADAEAAAKALKARGKGEHFVRQVKQEMF
jgi:hypothetical protein